METKTFEERLDEQLNFAKDNFYDPSKNFGINFSNERMVIFQIIDRVILEKVEGQDFGFGIHLAFDDTFPETAGELIRFKNSNFFDQFDYHTWDDIDTYQIDLKNDKEKVKDLTRKIIQIIYEKNESQVEIDLFEI